MTFIYLNGSDRKEFIKNYHAEWLKRNLKRVNSNSSEPKEILKFYKKNYSKVKFYGGITRKLATNLSKNLRKFLNKHQERDLAISNLGCSMNFLRGYIEIQFKSGMTWENYGNGRNNWNIDHIIPLSKFDLTDKEQLVKACNFSNLQPLWAIENTSKGNKVLSQTA